MVYVQALGDLLLAKTFEPEQESRHLLPLDTERPADAIRDKEVGVGACIRTESQFFDIDTATT